MSKRWWPSESDHAEPALPGSRTNSTPAEPSDEAFPSGPPRDVLDALGTAQLVLQELSAFGRHLSLHECDGTLRVRVAEADGAVVQEISTVRALEILSGKRAPRPE